MSMHPAALSVPLRPRYGLDRIDADTPKAHRIDLPADQVTRSVPDASRARNQSPTYQRDHNSLAVPQNVKCYFYTKSQGRSFRFAMKQFMFWYHNSSTTQCRNFDPLFNQGTWAFRKGPGFEEG